MLDFSNVVQKVRKVILMATGLVEGKVIIANQNSPRPRNTFCTVNIISEATLGQAYKELATLEAQATPAGRFADLSYSVRRAAKFTVSVNFFGGDSKQLASALQQANKRVHISSYMLDNDLGWLQAYNMRDKTDIEWGRYFPRTQIDVEMMTMDTHTDTVQSIYETDLGVYSPASEKLFEGDVSPPRG